MMKNYLRPICLALPELLKVLNRAELKSEQRIEGKYAHRFSKTQRMLVSFERLTIEITLEVRLPGEWEDCGTDMEKGWDPIYNISLGRETFADPSLAMYVQNGYYEDMDDYISGFEFALVPNDGQEFSRTIRIDNEDEDVFVMKCGFEISEEQHFQYSLLNDIPEHNVYRTLGSTLHCLREWEQEYGTGFQYIGVYVNSVHIEHQVQELASGQLAEDFYKFICDYTSQYEFAWNIILHRVATMEKFKEGL